MLRLLRASLNSWNGLRAAARSEEAFRQELWAFLVAVPAAFLIATDTWRRVLLIGVIVLLMIVELLNTAIEKLSDRLTTEHDLQIGRVKDMGSAAVGVALVTAGIFWLFSIAERMGVI